MKIDPYKHKERYIKWKEKTKYGIKDISIKNSDIIKKYLLDMENGINISSTSKKGSRSFTRLNNLIQRMVFLSKEFEKRYKCNLIGLKEEQLFEFFTAMRNGVVKRKDNKIYKSVCDYVYVFKAFWHWHIKVNKKQRIEIKDITTDLDTSKDKPKWVYLDEEQVRKLCDNAKYEYKILIMFLFDTGIRSPTELINIKVNDLHNNNKELYINDEISKTFGRRIKLMICSNLLRDFIITNNLKENDYLFKISPYVVNRYLKRLALRVLGEKISPAGQKYSELTMYDFRHISCCYWLPRYKSESALKYRFGWKKSDKIHYYSELLGMKDTISEEDLLIDITKTEIEQKLIISEKRNNIQQERINAMEEQIKKILKYINVVEEKL
ncbi:phage integrase family protein [Candidatus Pacearchaeota archaeon]|nr:phage integrase family protein [Candidatus Pacearchaeota archaeon]